MIPWCSYSSSVNTADALRRMVKTGADTTGGSSASKRDAIEWRLRGKFAFQDRVFAGDRAAEGGRDRSDERFRRCRRQPANRAHPLAEPVGPDSAIRVQHQLNHAGFRETGRERAELTLHGFRQPA